MALSACDFGELIFLQEVKALFMMDDGFKSVSFPLCTNKIFRTTAENEHLLFRGNSVATKAIEAYMKLVGEQYLHDTLQDPIQALITSAEDLEVDPFRITNLQSLPEQRNSLKEQVTAVWEKILQSSRNFPV